MNTIGYKTNRHKAFWKSENTAPLVGFCHGSYFVSKRYHAAGKLLELHRKIEPCDINVEDFAEDYIRMFEVWEKSNSDMIFTAAPFTGIPWMEAMLGCDVYSTGTSFIASSDHRSIEDADVGEIRNEHWLDKYIEFTCMLEKLSQGRFPVGQPIMRGPTDILGTIVGQDHLVYSFYDYPEKVARLLNDTVDVILYVIGEQKKHVSQFHGGQSIGFYDLWCPGRCIWFQDDLNALLSPEIYRKFIYEAHNRISRAYEYSLVHMHPAAFFLIDDFIGMPYLDAIEINKDVGGPSVTEMLPVFKKVQQAKKLVLWGDFSEEELLEINGALKPEGLCIITVKE